MGGDLKLLKRLLFFLVLFAILIPLGSVQADFAPPPDITSIGGIGPFYQSTEVQMVYERVEMELQVDQNQTSSGTLTNQILVKGWFVMHNQGSRDETMQVVFPLITNLDVCVYPDSPATLFSSSDSYQIDSSSFKVSVNGVVEPTTEMSTDNPDKAKMPPACQDNQINWAAMNVTFPVNKDILLGVSYMMTSSTSKDIEKVQYILETGAGWKGPIGRADIIFRYPYLVEPDNILQSYFQGTGTTPGYQTLYNEIYWNYENIKPTSNDNIAVSFPSPQTWQEILSLRNAIKKNSQDVDSWSRLIAIYDEIGGPGGSRGVNNDRYYQEVDQLYQGAIAANPESAQLNADYATWLAFQIGPSGTTQQYLNRILIYINKAFAVEPENKNALQALSMVENYAPDLTYTPPATIQATITPIPSITPTPTISPTATDTLFLTWTDTATPTRKPTKTSTSSPMPSPTPQFSESAHGYSKVTFWLALFAVILLAGAGYFYWRSNGKRSRQ
jgi:hypothetical protein